MNWVRDAVTDDAIIGADDVTCNKENCAVDFVDDVISLELEVGITERGRKCYY